jgi:hypothetical protein
MAAAKKIRNITDRLVQKVQIRLDGKDWPLVITHNVLIECEELTGLNVLAGEANLLKPSAKLVRALLFVALQRAGAKYTLEEVGDLITPQNLLLVQEGILKAWAASMPEPEPEENPTQAPM